MQIASVAVTLIVLAVAAMANGANTQSINGIYKTVFEDYVAEQVLNKFPMKDAFKPTTAEFAGQDVVYNAHTGRNVSPMWVGEDSAFATATRRQRRRCTSVSAS
jgi:hypothetical protein